MTDDPHLIRQAHRAAMVRIIALAEEGWARDAECPAEGYAYPSVANAAGYTLDAFRYAIHKYEQETGLGMDDPPKPPKPRLTIVAVARKETLR